MPSGDGNGRLAVGCCGNLERYGRARATRPVSASVVTSGQQQRRSGIIAATCPAVRVRIIRLNPIWKVGVAGAKTTSRSSQRQATVAESAGAWKEDRLFDTEVSVLHLMG
jgi:hypothetical protein